MKNILEVRDLIVEKDDVKVLGSLSFEVKENSVVCVLSSNKGGKTSLIEAISGIIKIRHGSLFFMGTKITRENFNIYTTNFGIVLEDIERAFIFDSVKRELEFPLLNLRYSKKNIEERVNQISKITKIDKILTKEISKLTKLEKVKLAISTTILHLPKILFLDDIFRELKESERDELRAILKDINSELKITILFTSSNLGDAIGLEHIIVLENRKKKLEGTFEEIILEDNELTKIGINIPIMVDLSRKLQFYKLLEDIHYDAEEVVDILWK